MPRVRRVRSFACVLLAVVTAVGTTPAVGRCGCAPAAKPAARAAAQPTAVATPKTCCRPAAEHGCCSVKGGQSSCCGERAKPSATPQAADGCGCARCDCDRPNPPTPAAPTPTGSQLADQATAVAAHPAPPAPLTLPAERITSVARHGSHPPTDLVITLSRLTC